MVGGSKREALEESWPPALKALVGHLTAVGAEARAASQRAALAEATAGDVGDVMLQQLQAKLRVITQHLPSEQGVSLAEVEEGTVDAPPADAFTTSCLKPPTAQPCAAGQPSGFTSDRPQHLQSVSSMAACTRSSAAAVSVHEQGAAEFEKQGEAPCSKDGADVTTGEECPSNAESPRTREASKDAASRERAFTLKSPETVELSATSDECSLIPAWVTAAERRFTSLESDVASMQEDIKRALLGVSQLHQARVAAVSSQAQEPVLRTPNPSAVEGESGMPHAHAVPEEVGEVETKQLSARSWRSRLSEGTSVSPAQSPLPSRRSISSLTDLRFETKQTKDLTEVVELGERALRRLEREGANTHQLMQRLEVQAEEWRSEARTASVVDDLELLKQRAISAQSQLEAFVKRSEQRDEQCAWDDDAARSRAEKTGRQRVEEALSTYDEQKRRTTNMKGCSANECIRSLGDNQMAKASAERAILGAEARGQRHPETL